MTALPRRHHEDGRRSVEHVTGGGDLAPGPQRVGEAGRRELRLVAAEHREDGADADVRVDVARAVERIEEHHVLAVVIGDLHLVELLAADDAAVPAALEHVHQHFVGERVELLHRLALHVRLAGVPEQIGQTCGTDARVDDADGEADVVEQRGELAGRALRGVHAVQDVLAERGPDDGSGLERRKAIGHEIAGVLACDAPWRKRQPRVTQECVTHLPVLVDR